MTESIIGALLAMVLFLAVYLDIRTSRIPNWLTFTAMGGGLFTHILLEGVHGAVFSLSGLGTGLILFLALYFLGDIGAGDVKLMGAIGAIIGPYGAFISCISAVMVGGIYALGAMCYQWGIALTGRKIAYAIQRALLSGGDGWTQELKLPFHLRYGLAIVGGTLLFLSGFHPFGG